MRRIAAVALACWGLAAVAAAQAPAAGRLELDAGVVWTASNGLGAASADLTRNPSTGPGPFTLFETRSELGGAVGAHATLGIWITPRWSIEGDVQFSRPTLRTHVSGDAEGAPDVTATVPLSQYLIGGSAVFQWSPGRRTVPYLAAGASYVRQLEHDDQLLQTGRELHVGGGVRVWFSSAHRIGLRAAARVSFPHGGISFQSGHHPVASGGLSVAYRF
ncbi:MAG TPA: outer membrane beta-barrel protein [Vicinamibacterales bacterium]|nr:outer membrane beta-barrel protein [Vicinamibacterales bacterium]